MNEARMSIRLPGETLDFVQGYARDRQMTLSELVLRYFDRLREAVARNDYQMPRCVSKVAGIVPPDVESEYRAHIAEKYL